MYQKPIPNLLFFSEKDFKNLFNKKHEKDGYIFSLSSYFSYKVYYVYLKEEDKHKIKNKNWLYIKSRKEYRLKRHRLTPKPIFFETNLELRDVINETLIFFLRHMSRTIREIYFYIPKSSNVIHNPLFDNLSLYFRLPTVLKSEIKDKFVTVENLPVMIFKKLYFYSTGEEIFIDKKFVDMQVPYFWIKEIVLNR
jgi:hypothetical protein